MYKQWTKPNLVLLCVMKNSLLFHVTRWVKELVITTVAMDTHCSNWSQVTIGSSDVELRNIKWRALVYQLVEVRVSASDTGEDVQSCLCASKPKRIAIVMAGLLGQVGRVVPIIYSLQCSFHLINYIFIWISLFFVLMSCLCLSSV